MLLVIWSVLAGVPFTFWLPIAGPLGSALAVGGLLAMLYMIVLCKKLGSDSRSFDQEVHKQVRGRMGMFM